MNSKQIFVVIGVFAMVFGRLGAMMAITCYRCASDEQSSCMDPFKSDGIATCTNVTCFKSSGTSGGRRITFVLLHHSHSALLISFAVSHSGNLHSILQLHGLLDAFTHLE